MAKTFALIVTYGAHKAQLTKVLHKTLNNSKIDHIFIVDNGSTYNLVKEISEVSSDKVSLITLKTNTGSAGGFGRGIREVVKYSRNNEDRLLILDDDSYAELDALDKIDNYEHNLSRTYEHIWSLNRLQIDESPRPEYKDFDYSIKYYYNSFYRFSVTSLFGKSRYRIRRNNKHIKHMVFAPYSGLLIGLSIINKVGFPNEKMYLYSDDIDYTFRISEQGIDILQAFDANIRDIAGSWFNSKMHNVHDAFFEGTEDNYRALYAYRNEAYLAKYVTQKNILFSNINYYAWLVNLIVRRMPKNKKGIRQFIKIITVVRMGRKKDLGQFKINCSRVKVNQRNK